MNSDALHYVTTEDGYRIAYTVSGAGDPFLLTPCLVQGDILRDSDVLRGFASALTQRFRLIRYDARGTGNSTRGLPEDLAIEDTTRDTITVVEHLGLENFILYGDVFSSYTTLHVAARLNRKIRAVVLVNPVPFHGKPLMAEWMEMYTSAWEMFTNTFVATFGSPGKSAAELRESVDQTDFMRLAMSARGRFLADVVNDSVPPTLVLESRNRMDPLAAQAARDIVAGIPMSELVLFDGHKGNDILSAPDGGPPPVLPAIDEFLKRLQAGPDTTKVREQTVRLSPRQTEVLRLIMDGKTTREIADCLVLSDRTVERHIGELYARIGARNRSEATAYGLTVLNHS
jgi:pimeloyl-ACP methyl ester carboxylesterase/DNA-binding CsgD family transcriptional regulator